MKTKIKQTGLMLLSIIVTIAFATGCKPKQQAATAGGIPPEIVTASPQEIMEMQATLGREYKDDEMADYSKMINASIKADRITASSFLESNSGTLSYKPENIHDFDFQNAWVEGAQGAGIGEYIEFHFPKRPSIITKVVIANGYVKSEKTYRENSRPKKLKMYIDDNPVAVLIL